MFHQKFRSKRLSGDEGGGHILRKQEHNHLYGKNPPVGKYFSWLEMSHWKTGRSEKSVACSLELENFTNRLACILYLVACSLNS